MPLRYSHQMSALKMLANSRALPLRLSKWNRLLSSSTTAKLPDLHLKDKIETTRHKGSFMRELFFNRIDPRILAYPRVIIKDEEFQAMKSVPDILKQNIHSLAEIGNRSATEIAIIYEATGRLGVPEILDHIQHTMSHYLLNQVDRRIPETTKVGYGYTEREAKMGALPPSEWEALATYNAESETWHIKGTKTMLIDEQYEKYIIFCKNQQVIVEGWPSDRPPPVAYAAFLLDKSNVTISRFSLGGINFQEISFDVHLTDDCVLFNPSVDKDEQFKSKAIGHLAVSAWILGRLKEYFGLTMVRNDLNWLYMFHLCALDSLVYYVAGLMDSFSGTDFELEGLALKVNAMEMAERCTKVLLMCHPDCRKSNFGLIGALNDSFSLANLFYESDDRAKILLGLEGIAYVASYEHDYIHREILLPIYPEVVLTRLRKWFEKKFRRNAPKLTGYFCLDLSHTCSIIQEIIDILAQGTNYHLVKHSKDIMLQQSDLQRMGHLSALVLKMIASHARADMYNKDKLSGFDHLVIANYHCVRYDKGLVEDLIWKLFSDRLHSGDAAIDKIYSRSLKYGGYWAYSPLDKVFY